MSSREQFEAYQRKASPKSFDLRHAGGVYINPITQSDWEVWQASRQALEITLPSRLNESTQSYERDLANMAFNEAIDDCREAIEAAGVRVKP